MKKNQISRFSCGIRGSARFLLTLLGIIICLSCSREELNEAQVESSDFYASASADAKATTFSEITFRATAEIESCHGENIQFTGIIQNRVSKTIDARGVVHYTRSFITRGMTGTGVNSGKEYDVLGGAEMFAIKDAVLNEDGSLNLTKSIAESDIVIHQGTLVFRSRVDGSKVVARHVIRKVPGQKTVSEWRCGGRG